MGHRKSTFAVKNKTKAQEPLDGRSPNKTSVTFSAGVHSTMFTTSFSQDFSQMGIQGWFSIVMESESELVVSGDIKKSTYNLVKIKNRSHKLSHSMTELESE